LKIFVEFNGIIEIIAENNDMLLAFGTTWGHDAKLAVEGFFNASLIPDEYVGTENSSILHLFADKVGTERYLTVNAYRFENEDTPIIKAQLKLVLIEDRLANMNGNKGFSRRCFSIELISYEYSDIYKLLDDIVDDEDE
jgi:hypothetical protein